MAKEPGKLTPRQERFCQLYCISFDGTQSAIKSGYSKKSAGSQSAQLMANPKIKQRISEILADDGERHGRLKAKVLHQLEEVVSFDLTKLIGKDGALSDFRKIPPAVLSGIKVTRSGNQAILFSREKANELLMRHLGMLNDRVDVTSGGQAIQINVTNREIANNIDQAVGSLDS